MAADHNPTAVAPPAEELAAPPLAGAGGAWTDRGCPEEGGQRNQACNESTGKVRFYEVDGFQVFVLLNQGSAGVFLGKIIQLAPGKKIYSGNFPKCPKYS